MTINIYGEEYFMIYNEEFIIVKVLRDSREIIERIVESINKSEEKYYNIVDLDQNCIKHLTALSELNVVFVLFENMDEKYKPYEIFVGKGCFIESPRVPGNYNLKYIIEYRSQSKLVIDNFVYSAGIDLKDDFNKGCYVITETSIALYRKLLDSLSKSKEDFSYKKVYKAHSNDPIGKLSQKNSDCIRPFHSQNKDFKEQRAEFQRDRERILHSKAFRRLVDKAQIFTSKKGDHFRTRMTHTLEVTQISRGIARLLNLNEDLTEAIALAHDLGHTPFGHQGERTLQMLLDKEIKRLPKAMQESRRFKHNFHGVRVLTFLEEKYIGFEGLNLSYQVLEGVLKHTKCCPKGIKCVKDSCDHYCVIMEDFIINGNKDMLFLQYKYPTTLEGQIVRIADEIAQRGHDLDDAFASKLLSYAEFEEICRIKKLGPLKELTKIVREKADQQDMEGFYFIDQHNVIRAELVSSIIGYLIKDVVQNSLQKIEEYDDSDRLFLEDTRIKDLVIDFSPNTKFIVEYLESEISKKVINSYDVVMFDDTSEKIIITLFKAYLNSPKLLPDSALRRLFKEFKRKKLDVIDFRDSEISLISSELERIKEYTFNPANELDKEDNIYAQKFDLLLHCIIDHISGMTDNFATNEYHKIIGI